MTAEERVEMAIRSMYQVAGDIYESFEASRPNIRAIIPQDDVDSNTIEKFSNHFIPNEMDSYRSCHLVKLLPNEFSCDEETLCAETFSRSLLDYLPILRAHLRIILDMEREYKNKGDLHQTLLHDFHTAIRQVERVLAEFRAGHNLDQLEPSQYPVDELPERTDAYTRSAYYIAIVSHIKTTTGKMCDLFLKL